METGDKELPFLDILIKRNDDKMWMDICFKLTDIRGYFPFWSSLSNHCKEWIPFTLARRICTIVVNKQQELRQLSELKENLKKHDYPVNIITNGIKKALEIPQDELAKLKEKQIYEILSFIFTFNFTFLQLMYIYITHLYITQLRIPLKSLR